MSEQQESKRILTAEKLAVLQSQSEAARAQWFAEPGQLTTGKEVSNIVFTCAFPIADHPEKTCMTMQKFFTGGEDDPYPLVYLIYENTPDPSVKEVFPAEYASYCDKSLAYALEWFIGEKQQIELQGRKEEPTAPTGIPIAASSFDWIMQQLTDVVARGAAEKELERVKQEEETMRGLQLAMQDVISTFTAPSMDVPPIAYSGAAYAPLSDAGSLSSLSSGSDSQSSCEYYVPPSEAGSEDGRSPYPSFDYQNSSASSATGSEGSTDSKENRYPIYDGKADSVSDDLDTRDAPTGLPAEEPTTATPFNPYRRYEDRIREARKAAKKKIKLQEYTDDLGQQARGNIAAWQAENDIPEDVLKRIHFVVPFNSVNPKQSYEVSAFGKEVQFICCIEDRTDHVKTYISVGDPRLFIRAGIRQRNVKDFVTLKQDRGKWRVISEGGHLTEIEAQLLASWGLVRDAKRGICKSGSVAPTVDCSLLALIAGQKMNWIAAVKAWLVANEVLESHHASIHFIITGNQFSNGELHCYGIYLCGGEYRFGFLWESDRITQCTEEECGAPAAGMVGRSVYEPFEYKADRRDPVLTLWNHIGYSSFHICPKFFPDSCVRLIFRMGLTIDAGGIVKGRKDKKLLSEKEVEEELHQYRQTVATSSSASYSATPSRH